MDNLTSYFNTKQPREEVKEDLPNIIYKDLREKSVER
jgi:hypothetical protein